MICLINEPVLSPVSLKHLSDIWMKVSGFFYPGCVGTFYCKFSWQEIHNNQILEHVIKHGWAEVKVTFGDITFLTRYIKKVKSCSDNIGHINFWTSEIFSYRFGLPQVTINLASTTTKLKWKFPDKLPSNAIFKNFMKLQNIWRIFKVGGKIAQNFAQNHSQIGTFGHSSQIS